MTELIIDFDASTEEEGPYEALCNAVSCHSLDSVASGRSSDRDSGSKETDSAAVKAAGVRPVCGPGPLAAWSFFVLRAFGGAGLRVRALHQLTCQRPGPTPCPAALPQLRLS